MFIVLKKALSQIMQSGHGTTVFESEMHSLMQTKAVADTLVQSRLSIIGSILLIVNMVEKFVH